MANKANRFVKGSTTFICECCGHNTRFTNDQAVGAKMCPACWDLAGYENMIQDGNFEESDAIQVISIFNEILKRSHIEFEKAKKAHDLAWTNELVEARLIKNLEENTAKNKKQKVEATKSTVKYDYPAGLTQAQKKVFRAKARRSK